MEITWLGHSCFRIKGKDIVLVTDPYSDNIGYAPVNLSANIVTISHNHPGHNNVDCLENGPKIVSKPGEYEIGGVFITGISSFHDMEQGRVNGKNNIFVMDIDDVRICHLGDLGHVPSPGKLENLGNIDVLFVPVGGISTIDAKLASEIVRFINPKITIPMHYGNEVTTWLDPSDKFLIEIGLRDTVPQPKLNISRSNLSSETQVVLLDYSGN